MAAKRSGRARRGSSSSGKYRSAVSGRYVTKKYGKSHPKTTVKGRNRPLALRCCRANTRQQRESIPSRRTETFSNEFRKYLNGD